MSAHTPGPWTLDDAGLGIVLDASGEAVLTAGLECPNDVDGSGYANAQLIAAAPELLATLKATLDWLASYPFGDAVPVYDRAVAVIAKAEGQ